jgi:hypothetical protein
MPFRDYLFWSGSHRDFARGLPLIRTVMCLIFDRRWGCENSCCKARSVIIYRQIVGLELLALLALARPFGLTPIGLTLLLTLQLCSKWSRNSNVTKTQVA